jgi:general stress protein 26
MARSEREHLIDLIEDFDVAMLATHARDGDLRGRPMWVASVHDDGEVAFCTNLDSEKLRELESDPRCAVLMQGKNKWVSLTGTARIEQDRDRIHEVWRESWRLWFPEGKDDPNLCLLIVSTQQAEFWDESGFRPLQFVADAARAWINKTPPQPSREQTAKVLL